MKISVIDDGIDKEIAENGLHINYRYYDVNQIVGNGIRHETKVVGTV